MVFTTFQVDKFWHSNGNPVYTEGKETRAVRVEEVHHAITQVGYGKAYPKMFDVDFVRNSMLDVLYVGTS